MLQYLQNAARPKCQFIYAHKKHMAFPRPIFKKLTNVHQDYVQIPYNTFHPNKKWMRKV
jgi:hypothetical protein